ncbi:hypothetical protein GYMLUDRAFT_39611 [Collybiopsis luxurians FD-317 M1]|nr:hypothetical protein GYMLUDRAFT_39611 [Collybiopsis luxurians FD-317 M1]
MDVFSSFPNIDEAESASNFLHTYLNRNSDEESQYSRELCVASFSEDPKIHGMLRVAHESKDLVALERVCTYFKRNAWRFVPRLNGLNEVLRRIESAGTTTTEVVNGKLKKPVWTPTESSANVETKDFIRNLQIPLGHIEEVPLVILHRLGHFQHDSILRKRLDHIFSPLNHTFLVNASGTGKTRLLFEGLCLHWGFYLPFTTDSSFLGAGDFARIADQVKNEVNWTSYLPPKSHASYASTLQNNLHAVDRVVSEALLARLLVFKIYLEACAKEGFCHDHRQRWLESQIFPENLTASLDPFVFIKVKISAAWLDDSVVNEAITRTLEAIQDTWAIPTGEFLYIALDEANVASRKHEHAFEDEAGRYPVLKEVIRALRRRLGHLPIRFVVAGTVIPAEHFQSAIGEWDDWHWCSDTGSFDSPDSQRRYISQFLPPDFESSAKGQVLLDRMWQWLRGRHRYTASYLTVLLGSGFESSHMLLSGFVENVGKYLPPENDEYSRGEPDRYNNWYSELGSNGLKRGSISTLEMHRAVISYLTTSRGCLDCIVKDRTLVTEDYGYFTASDCSGIVVDEPLTVIYGAGWFKNVDHKITTFNNFGHDYEIEIRPSHFALFLALSFASFFSGFSKVSDAFTISGLPSSSFEAKLVTFKKVGEHLETTDIHFSEHSPERLALLAETREEALSWFKHERDEPFCVLQSSARPSATLVFSLQLSDTRSFWVFVHVPATFTEQETPTFAQDIEDAQPAKVFRDWPEITSILEELPNRYLDMGPFTVLRVSGSFWVDKATRDSIPREQNPAAILNISKLEEAAKNVSQDMLMRRLARIFAQGKVPLPLAAVSMTSARDDDVGRHRRRRQQQQQQRHRPTAESAGEPSSSAEQKRGKSMKTERAASHTAPASGAQSRKRKKRPPTKSASAAPTADDDRSTKAEEGDRESSEKKVRTRTRRRFPGKVNAVATGRASPGVPSPATPTAPRYNLRKR